MDPATMAALASAAASLGGSAMSNRAQRKANEEAKAMNQADKAMAQQYAQAAMQQLPVGYQNAQDVRQQSLNQALGLTGQTFQPTAEMINQGGMMNQNTLLAGLGLSRNAILGKEMDYSTLQAMSPQIDYSALQGLTQPQGLNFQPIEPLKNTFTMPQAEIQTYLDENPDIAADYQRLLPQLREGDPNNPNYRDVQSYAKWHYDNIGKYEIEQGKRAPIGSKAGQGAAQTSQLVTSEQMSKILNAGQER